MDSVVTLTNQKSETKVLHYDMVKICNKNIYRYFCAVFFSIKHDEVLTDKHKETILQPNVT